MQRSVPPPTALKLLTGLGKGSPGLSQGSETVKAFMALRSRLARATIVAINLSGPCEGDTLGHESQGTVEQRQGGATAELGVLGPVSRAHHRLTSFHPLRKPQRQRLL